MPVTLVRTSLAEGAHPQSSVWSVPDLVVTSPLTRTVQTALLSLGPLDAGRTPSPSATIASARGMGGVPMVFFIYPIFVVRFIAYEDCRERVSHFMCDGLFSTPIPSHPTTTTTTTTSGYMHHVLSHHPSTSFLFICTPKGRREREALERDFGCGSCVPFGAIHLKCP